MQELSDILNWRRWDARVTLSGQPTEAQLGEIKALGVTHVINLGPHDNNGALVDEAASVAVLGMEYVYSPVDFEQPTKADFDAFCHEMERLRGETLHVHCIYNARVSAFFYRFALEGRGGDVDMAFKLMDGIWRPGGVWAAFIGKPQDSDQPNRYEGYEYNLRTSPSTKNL